MEPLILYGAKDTPSVYFDQAANLFEITGVSLPANVLDFYGQVLDWMDKYVQNPNENTILTLRLEYLNTSSAKVINVLIRKLEHIIKAGKKASVCWHYAVNEPEMKELGEDYSVGTKVPFDLKPFEN
jgi:hypothetical protein